MQQIKKWKRQIARITKLVTLLSIGCFGTVAQADTVYVANLNRVSVIDTNLNWVVTTIPVSDSPYGITVNPSGTRVYVTNYRDNNVSVIDSSINKVVATVPVGTKPFNMAVNPSGTRVYVTNYVSNNVSVIDTGTNSVVATVAVKDYPDGVAVNPSGKYVYVTSWDDTVSVIDTDTNSVVATIPVGDHPDGIVVNPSGTRIYVANYMSNNVSVIDSNTNRVVATIPVGTRPSRMAINSSGTRVYVTNCMSDNINVIDTDTNSVVATVVVKYCPFDGILICQSGPMAINPSGTLIYMAGLGAVSVIDTSINSVVATIPMEDNTHQGIAIIGSTSTPNGDILGNGKIINGTNIFVDPNLISTNTSFAGGASVDKVNYKAYLTTSPSSNLTVKALITVDPADVGKQADLLYVAGFENQAPFDGGIDTTYAVIDEMGNFSTVDLYNQPSVWMNQLAAKPFKRNVTLQQEMVVDAVNAGQLFTKPSVNYYFMGYRLQDGTLVYTPIPIIINIQ